MRGPGGGGTGGRSLGGRGLGVGVVFWRCARFSRGSASGQSCQVRERGWEPSSPGWGFLAYARSLVGLFWGGGCSLRLVPETPLPFRPHQFSYHNFDRSRHDDDDIRGCAVLDLASLQWVAMQCETQLDWICKIPRGWVGRRWRSGHGTKGGGGGGPGEGHLSLQRLCPCCPHRRGRAGA